MEGAYRKILGHPKNVRAKLLRYRDPDVDLAISDEDRLLGEPEPESDPEGPFLALQLSFQLGSSCYATMVLREVLKTDTSSSNQRELTMRGEDRAFKGAASGSGGGGGGRGQVNFIQAKRKRAWGGAGEGEAASESALAPSEATEAQASKEQAPATSADQASS